MNAAPPRVGFQKPHGAVEWRPVTALCLSHRPTTCSEKKSVSSTGALLYLSHDHAGPQPNPDDNIDRPAAPIGDGKFPLSCPFAAERMRSPREKTSFELTLSHSISGSRRLFSPPRTALSSVFLHARVIRAKLPPMLGYEGRTFGSDPNSLNFRFV